MASKPPTRRTRNGPHSGPVDDRLHIKYVPTTSLRPNPKNPRVHSKRQIKQMVRSLKAFRFIAPITIDRNRSIVAGHARHLAALDLGMQEVPTIMVDHLSEAEQRAYMIADNKLAMNSSWDDALLTDHFRELAVLDLDFSLDVTGFDMGEIDHRLEMGGAEIGAESDAADAAPPAGPAICKLGQLWLLDKHRVLCGDALDSKSYTPLLQGEKADVVFTDPPYNLPIKGTVSGLGRAVHREFQMASGEMSSHAFRDFLRQVCLAMARESVVGSLHFLCMDWRHTGDLLAVGADAYSELKNIAVWVKNTGGMGSLYRSQHEFVVIFKSGKGSHRNNVQLGKYGRNRTNVWNYPSANTFSRQTDEGHLLSLHPTVKPVALVADALLDASARGGIVLDPFLGSGTTLIAAERVGRCCRGIEIDPLYVDVAIRRWEAFSGQSAVLQGTKSTFKALERQAGARQPGPPKVRTAKTRSAA